MEIQTKFSGEIPVISLSGSLNSSIQCNELLKVLEEDVFPKSTKVVINIKNLTYMNSEGIGVFITILTKSRNRSGELMLTNVNQTIKKLLAITKLENIFNIEETEAQGVAFLTK
ncbi:MAG: anti-sigma B factor antagonist [Sphingobacteriales bacterium]|jgi:anti-sigma B factor antagonist